MALNKQNLKDLFGAPSKPRTAKNTPVFDDEDVDDQQTDFTDFPDIEDEEDSLLPAPAVYKDVEAKPISDKDIDVDADYAIKTQESLINQSQQLVSLALATAAEGGNARDIEVAAGAINAATAAVEKLLDLHSKIQKLKQTSTEQNVGTGNTFVNNQVVFQGTTKDLLSKIEAGEIDVDKL